MLRIPRFSSVFTCQRVYTPLLRPLIPLLHSIRTCTASPALEPCEIRADHPFPIERKIDEPVADPNRLFAIFSCSGSQFKVTEGDVIMTHLQPHLEVGKSVEYSQVLLVGSSQFTVIGKPLVKNCVVKATVQEQCKLGKLIVFKMKRRKGYRKKEGVRAPVTILKIDSIHLNSH